MISGVIRRFEDDSLFFSLFADLEEKFLVESTSPNAMYQFINEAQSVGAFIGNHQDRFILVVFSETDRADFYQDLACLFLYSQSVGLETTCQSILALLKREDSLSTVLLAERDKLLYISVLGESNVAVMTLPAASYFLT
jgi:hypothetical protein